MRTYLSIIPGVLVSLPALLVAGLVAGAHAADEAETWWTAARDNAGRYPVRTRLLDGALRPRHVNALILERSPYLLQHAHDPVRWRAWSEEVVKLARRESRLIFLSIGYSSCHWCHVMARESFDDEGIARLLNATYVSIKIDREEYPDLDEHFLKRLALLTGSPGHPANLILTPTGEVVTGDTYLSPVKLSGLLTRMAQAWERRPEEVRRLAATVEAQFKPRVSNAAVDVAKLRDAALAAIRRQYDPTHHGFGTAPKFPNAAALTVLLDAYRREHDANDRRMVLDTLRAMARSALHDFVAGGFFRYSVSADWQRPHFEKTLYDQALLAPLFAEAWTLTGEAVFADAAERTLVFAERVMRTPDGLFASALDADSEGREGGHYLWTEAELAGRLEATERAALTRHLQRVEQDGGAFLLVPRDAVAPQSLDPIVEKVRALRDLRSPLFVDDKAITGWNALMVEALAQSGRLLGRARHIESAAATMRQLLARNTGEGRVYRYSIDGGAHLGASLEDVAYLLRALALLHEIDGSSFWLERADAIVKTLPGGVVLADQLRNASHDRHLPAPSAALLAALDRLARQTGVRHHRETADALSGHLRGVVRIDADDQATVIGALYERAHPGPLRKAFLADGHVRAEITTLARPGERSEFEVTIRIDPPWHITGHRPLQDALIPTRIEAEPGSTIEVSYPPAREVTLGIATGPVGVYEGTIKLTGTIDGARWASGAFLKLSVQACSDRVCLLPETVRLFR